MDYFADYGLSSLGCVRLCPFRPLLDRTAARLSVLSCHPVLVVFLRTLILSCHVSDSAHFAFSY